MSTIGEAVDYVPITQFVVLQDLHGFARFLQDCYSNLSSCKICTVLQDSCKTDIGLQVSYKTWYSCKLLKEKQNETRNLFITSLVWQTREVIRFRVSFCFSLSFPIEYYPQIRSNVQIRSFIAVELQLTRTSTFKLLYNSIHNR